MVKKCEVKESEKFIGTFTKTCKNQMNDPLRLNAKISASDYSSYRCLSTSQDDVSIIVLQTLVRNCSEYMYFNVITLQSMPHAAINVAVASNNCKKCFKKDISSELSKHPSP